MKTRSDIVIETGIKHNSMFEPNSIDCDATVDEMNKFYREAAQMQSASIGKKNSMPYFDTTPSKSRKKNELVIELPNDVQITRSLIK